MRTELNVANNYYYMTAVNPPRRLDFEAYTNLSTAMLERENHSQLRP